MGLMAIQVGLIVDRAVKRGLGQFWLVEMRAKSGC